jgi:hypothetical protein
MMLSAMLKLFNEKGLAALAGTRALLLNEPVHARKSSGRAVMTDDNGLVDGGSGKSWAMAWFTWRA